MAGSAGLERPDPIGEILQSALDDWVMATEVWDIVTRIYSLDIESTRIFCEGLTSTLVGDGLMIPGRVSAAGFEPFASDTPGNLERLGRAWRPVDKLPEFGEVAWFAITEKGRNLASSIGRGNSRWPSIPPQVPY